MIEEERAVSPAVEKKRWPRGVFYLTLLIAFALDQATKAWAVASLAPEVRGVPIIPGFFRLIYQTNTGVAFSLFAGHGLLIGAFVVVLAIVGLYFAREINWAGWEPNLIGGCLIGGALGNLVDRARHGYVVDFFDAYIGPHHWPTFNVADSFICVAVGWIVVRQLTSKN